MSVISELKTYSSLANKRQTVWFKDGPVVLLTVVLYIIVL